jgi:hypothetical protein
MKANNAFIETDLKRRLSHVAAVRLLACTMARCVGGTGGPMRGSRKASHKKWPSLFQRRLDRRRRGELPRKNAAIALGKTAAVRCPAMETTFTDNGTPEPGVHGYPRMSIPLSSPVQPSLSNCAAPVVIGM